MEKYKSKYYERKTKSGETFLQFDSMSILIDFVESNKGKTVNNNLNLSSETYDSTFTGTRTFDEAIGLAKFGWETGIKQLNDKIKISSNNVSYEREYSVVGGRASVPRYMSGIPTNMINKKRVEHKDKVITLVKTGSVNCMATTEAILNNNVKFIQIIQNLESQGYRCNVDMIYGVTESVLGGTPKDLEIIRVRIKKSGERLNISKMSFPLAHASMYRRFIFKVREMDELITNTKINASGYGYSLSNNESNEKKVISRFLKDNEYHIPFWINEKPENYKLELK